MNHNQSKGSDSGAGDNKQLLSPIIHPGKPFTSWSPITPHTYLMTCSIGVKCCDFTNATVWIIISCKAATKAVLVSKTSTCNWKCLITSNYVITVTENALVATGAKPSTGIVLTTSLDIFSSNMMTSSNGNIFRVTGHLCGEFTGLRWIPHTKASDAELCCLLWSAPE